MANLEDSGVELPCVPIQCPRCLQRLRGFPVTAEEEWVAKCATCRRYVREAVSKTIPEVLECRHVLTDGRRCADVVRCLRDWPLELP